MKTQTVQGIQTGPSVPIIGPARAGKTAKLLKAQFPALIHVSDSLQAVRIDVKDSDRTGANPQEFTKCAFAKAACRMLKADGAFIGIRSSYLIFKNHAIRFHTPGTVAREIVTFDRHQDFATGIYRLSPVSPSQRLGSPHVKRSTHEKKGKGKRGTLHRTTRVRAIE